MGVGQVPVVHQHQAIRRIHIKGLCLFFAERITRGGVTHLTQAVVTGQGAHVAGTKHITHHPLGLVHEELTVELRDDARGILSPVLQQQQGVINQLVHRCVACNADDATH